jgi:hypothetical protein
MYTARDKLGLVGALVAVAVLLWVGKSHFGGTSSSGGSPQTGTTSSATAARKAALAYLDRVGRIDAVTERYARRESNVMMAELHNPGPLTPAERQGLTSMGNVMLNAARHLQRLQPSAGFEQAQQLLITTYKDQNHVARAVVNLGSGGASVQTDPNKVLDQLTRISNAAGAFDHDLPVCRAAFRSAAAAAGVPTPPWLAGLFLHAKGNPNA